ncbi:MAG: hypothetical protein LBQ61_03965, partial [Spirochaetales bacterium]|nr:hypothetical protein [Spirochaetales bacterium]
MSLSDPGCNKAGKFPFPGLLILLLGAPWLLTCQTQPPSPAALPGAPPSQEAPLPPPPPPGLSGEAPFLPSRPDLLSPGT